MKRQLDVFLVIAILLVVIFKVIILRSLIPSIFPFYYLYLITGVLAFWVMSKIDFTILSLFYKPIYVFSIFFLVATIVIGQVTRGAIRWIPIGSFTFFARPLRPSFGSMGRSFCERRALPAIFV